MGIRLHAAAGMRRQQFLPIRPVESCQAGGTMGLESGIQRWRPCARLMVEHGVILGVCGA